MKTNYRSAFSCYSLILRNLPLPTIIEGISYLGSAVIAGLMPIAWKHLFDAVYNVIQKDDLNGLITPLLVFSLFQLLEVIFRLLGRVSSRILGYNEKIVALLQKQLYEHAIKLSLENYETKDIYDSYYKATNAIQRNSAINFINTFYQLPSMILSLVIMTFTVWVFSPWLVFVAAISILPASVMRIIKGQRFYEMKKYQTPRIRKRDYLWSLFLKSTSIKEMRAYNSIEFFKNKWETERNILNKEELSFTKKSIKTQFPADAFRILGYGFGIVFSSILLINGIITPGSFGAVIGAFNGLQQQYDHVLSIIGSVKNEILFFNDYTGFLGVKPEKTGKQQLHKNCGIELHNVSFSYPNAKSPVIKNINLTIGNHERIAIIGKNGSGKSTLCKIIAGLYTPRQGYIAYRKCNNDEIDKKSLYSHTSAVFQDYIKYLLTIRENVGFGDIHKINNDNLIKAALCKAGMDYMLEETKTIDAQLGREFDGFELSGGQWQRIAISRGIYRDSSIIIFDEPTAALDPIIESEIFKTFLDAANNQCTILVSHRIGTAQFVDRIIVLKDGEIVQVGKHEELIKQKGEYSTLFHMQAKWYV